MRCDLHVHTIHSGMCTVAGLRHWVRECYSEPAAVVDVLRRRGMNLFTITDDDSVAAADALGGLPAFFTSAEVTCRTPAGCEAHIGVYDIGETQHEAIQNRRNDLPALAAYLRERNIFASVNHVVSGITGRRSERDFEHFEGFEGMEVRNGQVAAGANRCAAGLAQAWRKVALGGSDAHTLASAGRTWTEVPEARTKDEFFAGLRAGRGRIGGLAGGWLNLTRDVLSIAQSAFAEHPALAWLAPAVPLVPMFTGLQFLFDRCSGWMWERRLLGRRRAGAGVTVPGEVL